MVKSKFMKEANAGYMPKQVLWARRLRQQLHKEDRLMQVLLLAKENCSNDMERNLVADAIVMGEKHKKELEWALVELELKNKEPDEEMFQRHDAEGAALDERRKRELPD